MDEKQNDRQPEEVKPRSGFNREKYRKMLYGVIQSTRKIVGKFGDWSRIAWRVAKKGLMKALLILTRLWEAGKDLKIKEDIQKAFGHLRPRRIAAIGVMALLAMYFATGFYTVNPGERAVERLFGRVVEEVISEGLHYRLPWPFQQVDKVNVAAIQREGIGLLLPEHRGVHSSPKKIQILTGDENIVDVELVIQFHITDPSKYLFNVDYQSYQIINEIVRYTVTRITGSMLVDDILTIAKEEIQRMVRTETQQLLDSYETGLSIITVNIKKIYPPKDVADSFLDVASAREDRSRTVNQAEGYRNGLIPPARGEAERKLRQAEGYKVEVINQAQGETQRFLQMLAEYRKTGGSAYSDVTLDRLYLETMEKILPKVKMYVLNSNGKGKINLRFFEDK